MSQGHYVSGDYYLICDHSGFKIRASESVRLWDGRRVHRKFAGEETNRHPQECVRGRADRQRVADPRPEATDQFHDIGDITASDLG